MRLLIYLSLFSRGLECRFLISLIAPRDCRPNIYVRQAGFYVRQCGGIIKQIGVSVIILRVYRTSLVCNLNWSSGPLHDVMLSLQLM